MKNKYNYVLTEEETKTLINTLNTFFKKDKDFKESEYLIIPETGNQFLIEWTVQTNKKVIILRKQTKDKIIQKLSEQTMMKAEKVKLLKAIEAMNEVKMANIAGNQRKRLIECLFEPLNKNVISTATNNKLMFIDDSIFSGYTFLAAQHVLKNINHHNRIFFSKQ